MVLASHSGNLKNGQQDAREEICIDKKAKAFSEGTTTL